MFKKILFPVDLEHPELAAKYCASLERIAGDFGAQIEVIAVIPGFGMPIVASYFPPGVEEQARKEVKARLKQFAETNFKQDVQTHVAEGKHWRKIVEYARKNQVDLIAIPHHSGKKRAEEVLIGSCAQKVSEHARCSVMILR